LFDPRTPVVTVIVYVVDGDSALEGVIVATLLPALKPILAVIDAPPLVSVIVDPFIVAAFIALLNVIVGDTFRATPLAALDGETFVTVGAVISTAAAVVNDAANGTSALPTASVIPDVAAIV
jgi:hypothetical protein